MAKKVSKKSEKAEKISENTVKIVMWQRFGSNVKHKRAEYLGYEKKDNYGNPVVINEKKGHNEDFGFSQDEVYSSLKITYDIEGKTKEKALESISKSIERTKKRIKALDDFPELGVFANFWDEKEKLENLRIFKRYLELRSDNGAYYKEDNGMRVYEYESIDGFLIPIWHDVDNLVDFTDYTYNKKVTLQEDRELKVFLDHKKKENMKYASFFMMMIIVCVLAGVFVFAIFKVLGYHQEAVEKWEEPANYCAVQSSKVIGTVLDVLNDDVVKSCLLATNKSDVIDRVNENIKTLDTNK